MARKKIIPKRIGSVKVPKALRKVGDEILSDPRARAAAGRALLAVGTVLAGRGAARREQATSFFGDVFNGARGPRPEAAESAAQKAGEAVNGVAQAVDQVVAEVVDRIRRDWARRNGGPQADDPIRPTTGAAPGDDRPN